MYRQEDEFDFLTDEQFKTMWFEATGSPVIIGCRFTPDPPMGEMVSEFFLDCGLISLCPFCLLRDVREMVERW